MPRYLNSGNTDLTSLSGGGFSFMAAEKMEALAKCDKGDEEKKE